MNSSKKPMNSCDQNSVMKYLKKSQIDEDRSGTFGNYHLTLENINSANINGRINQKIDEGQADMEFKVKSTAKMTASKINKDIGTLLVNPETQNGKELAVKCISDLIHKNKNDVHTDEGMIPAMENVYLPGLDKLDVEDDSELAAKKHYDQLEIHYENTKCFLQKTSLLTTPKDEPAENKFDLCETDDEEDFGDFMLSTYKYKLDVPTNTLKRKTRDNSVGNNFNPLPEVILNPLKRKYCLTGSSLMSMKSMYKKVHKLHEKHLQIREFDFTANIRIFRVFMKELCVQINKNGRHIFLGRENVEAVKQESDPIPKEKLFDIENIDFESLKITCTKEIEEFRLKMEVLKMKPPGIKLVISKSL
jgi:hypothetical protein